MEREDKVKMTSTPGELADMFRDLADALDQGGVRLRDVHVDWPALQKMTLIVRNAAGMADVKIKLGSALPRQVPTQSAHGKPGEGAMAGADAPRIAAPSQPPVEPGLKPRGGYGALKKRMKKSFKNIMYALHENSWPDQPDIDAFVHDSAQMVLYPDKGDEFYPAYSEAVAGFVNAVRARDMEAAYQAAHQLNMLKTQCHKKYD
jgi:XXXCH domain-containing protein